MSTRASRPTTLLDFDANFLHKDLRLDFLRHFETARAHNVAQFCVPGSTLADSSEALSLSKSHPSVIFATCGVHPYQTENIPLTPRTLAELDGLVSDEACAAVGECGLDFSEGFPPSAIQIPWFKAQIQLSVKHSLPLYLHIRGAHEEFLSIIGSEVGESGPPICVHCFTGTTKELEIYASRGYYVSLSGHVVRHKETIDIAEYLKIIPPDRLILETDAPYMGFKGCRSTELIKKTQNYPNVPAALPQIASHICESTTMSVSDLAAMTTENALRFLSAKK